MYSSQSFAIGSRKIEMERQKDRQREREKE